MNERKLFGVTVRFVGLLFFAYGIYCALYGTLGLLCCTMREGVPPLTGFIWSPVFLLLGLWLMRRPGRIVQLAFGPESPAENGPPSN